VVSRASGSFCWSLSRVTVYNDFGTFCIAPLCTHGSGITHSHALRIAQEKQNEKLNICLSYFFLRTIVSRRPKPVLDTGTLRNEVYCNPNIPLCLHQSIRNVKTSFMRCRNTDGFRRSLYGKNTGSVFNVSETHDFWGCKRHVPPKRRQNILHIHSAQRPKSRINKHCTAA
jgi:hypothetical protein